MMYQAILSPIQETALDQGNRREKVACVVGVDAREA